MRTEPENRWPTPAEWVDRFLSLPRDLQETRASKAIAASEAAFRCVERGHDTLTAELDTALRQRAAVIDYINGALEGAIQVERSKAPGKNAYTAVLLTSVQEDLRRKLGLPKEGE